MPEDCVICDCKIAGNDDYVFIFIQGYMHLECQGYMHLECFEEEYETNEGEG